MIAWAFSIHNMSTQTSEPAIPRDSLALRVMIARHERSLSQRAAALRCGLTFGEWQGLEGGAEEPRGLNQKIAKIAAGLGYDRNWLMWGGPLIAEPQPDGDGMGDYHPTTGQYSGDSRRIDYAA